MSRSPYVLAAVIALLILSNLIVSSLVGLGDAEALYYCYARHPSSSYLDHPPLIGWLIAAAIAVGGVNTLAVRMVPMTMTAACLLFTYLLTRDMFGRRAAAWSSVLMFSTPVVSVGMGPSMSPSRWS